MTITQLEYIIAIDTFRHFVKAADYCHVTQPTLSAQVQKLEDTLGVIIFNRQKQPIEPTTAGLEIIKRARQIVEQANNVREYADETKAQLMGELRIGIIPTLTPYLLPRFITAFIANYKDIHVTVHEMYTHQIIDALKNNSLDVALMITPLPDQNLNEELLFYEELVCYLSPQSPLLIKKQISVDDLENEHIWLLDDVHCLCKQIFSICGFLKTANIHSNFNFRPGSIETLKCLVDTCYGATILPEMALAELEEEQLDRVRFFKSPVPSRQISMVTTKDCIKKKLVKVFHAEMTKVVPEKIKQNTGVGMVPLVLN